MKNQLEELWRRWQKIARRIGEFQARLILSLCYFLIVVPVGLIARRFADPLGLKKTTARWHAKANSPSRLEDARRQF